MPRVPRGPPALPPIMPTSMRCGEERTRSTRVLGRERAPRPPVEPGAGPTAVGLATTQALTAVRAGRGGRCARAALRSKRRPTEEQRFRRAIARDTDGCGTRAFERAWAEGSRPTIAQANLEALDITASLMALAPDQATLSSAADGHG